MELRLRNRSPASCPAITLAVAETDSAALSYVRGNSFSPVQDTRFKVFVYDLSCLETLYRIFSFIALGLILLATSYLYHRYKGQILGNQTTQD